MRITIMILLITALTGCGPLLYPMSPQLKPELQHEYDQMWNNMLTPVNRVDRTALLDANVSYMMFTLGVDRLHLITEKNFSGGTVIMDIDCDRSRLDADTYTITVKNKRGRTIRVEKYSRSQVEESASIFGMKQVMSRQFGEHDELIINDPKGLPESVRRQVAAEAATQPSQKP